MPSSLTPETSPVLKRLVDASGIPFPVACRVLTFPDGGTVFVDKFIEYEDMPFVFATDGSLWRMISSNETNFGYTLLDKFSSSGADILCKGSTISESEAVALL